MNLIRENIKKPIKPASAIALLCCFALAGCGSDNDDSDNEGSTANDGSNAEIDTNTGSNDVEVVTSDQPALSSGNVSMVGTVLVSDEAGNVSDILGTFFSLDEPLSGDDLASRFSNLTSFCQVEPEGITNANGLTVGFIPEIPGANQAINAGDTVVLSETAGTYVTLSQQGVGELVFYGTDSTVAIPTGPVPDPLQAFVTGGEFPAFDGVSFPAITTLTGVSFGDTDTVTIDTQFTWDAGSSDDSFISILSSTQGGFFQEDSLMVTCLVQDNGTFSFPAEIQDALGQDYVGGTPIVSRVAVSTVVDNEAALFVVRESFSE